MRLVLLVTMLTALGFGCATTPQTPFAWETAGRVHVGMAEADVLRLLGPPRSRTRFHDAIESWTWSHGPTPFQISTFTIGVHQGSVVSVPPSNSALPSQMAADFRAGRADSEQQRRIDYVDRNPHLPPGIRDALVRGVVSMGMTPEQVRLTYGEPERINRTVHAHTTTEQWVYGRTYLYFRDDILTSWQDSR